MYQFFEQNNFKISIILLILFLRVFLLYFYNFRLILGSSIFCIKISSIGASRHDIWKRNIGSTIFYQFIVNFTDFS